MAWWTLSQVLVWIVRRIETLPRDAEEIASSPEMIPDIERAWNELQRELRQAIWSPPKGIPIAKCCFTWARHEELVTLIQHHNWSLDEIRWQDVEFNPTWIKRTWPASAHAPAMEAPPSRQPMAVDPPAPTADAAPTPDASVAESPQAEPQQLLPPPAAPAAEAVTPPPAPDKAAIANLAQGTPVPTAGPAAGSAASPAKSEAQPKAPPCGKPDRSAADSARGVSELVTTEEPGSAESRLQKVLAARPKAVPPARGKRSRAAWHIELYSLIDEGLDRALTNGAVARQLSDKYGVEVKTILNVLPNDKKFVAWREKT
jgi:hypothetical protein